MCLIRSNSTLKLVREALAFSQSSIGPGAQGKMYRDVLQDMINDCDRQRPLGADGRHSDLYTDNCGCRNLVH